MARDSIHILTVVGARPQFVKAAVLSHAFGADDRFTETIVHTGQHYDDRMSDSFFRSLGIPEPVANLNVGSFGHARQTGSIMIHLEEYLLEIDRPDAILVYGDTNSTLAAALVASKSAVPLVHVEAGLRSFNRAMPEEINRIVTDRLSSFLFCPTEEARRQLGREGISGGVVLSGDVMLEATKRFAALASDPFAELSDHEFAVATIHRAANTDSDDRFRAIISGLGRIGIPVLLPAHPRIGERLNSMTLPTNIRVIHPVSYPVMLSLISRADLVITDSGGLQKESIWLGTRCLTLRAETEWRETLQGNWNQLVDADPAGMHRAAKIRPQGQPPEFGLEDGRPASDHILAALQELSG